jgi:hypothetical protein
VAVSLKASAATLAALFFLFCGVEAAYASLGDVIDDVSGEVEETVGAVEEAADDVTDAADETVAGAKEKVDETVEQVTETADQAVGAVEEIVEGTPAGGVIEDVKRSVDPVVGTVEQSAGLTKSAPPPAKRNAPGVAVESPLGSSGSVVQQASPAAASSPANASQSLLSSAPQQQSASPHRAPPVQLTVSAAARSDGTAATSLNSLRMSPWGQPPAAPMDANGTEDSSSSPRAPALPFGPLFPVDLPATAAVVAGAAGSALTVALLGALLLLAPRTGRLARPGPILVGPDPCLSLPERPG